MSKWEPYHSFFYLCFSVSFNDLLYRHKWLLNPQLLIFNSFLQRNKTPFEFEILTTLNFLEVVGGEYLASF